MVNSSANYWIAANALSISLNALGDANRIQCGLATGSVIMCYIKGVEGLEYDNGHNYRRWPLTISPTYFNTYTHKYVYVAIPRNASVGNMAQVVFPSQKIDIYGYVVLDNGESSNERIGNDNYYYIWLQGIISSSGEQGTTARTWEAQVESGTLSTDEAVNPEGGKWYEWNNITQTVTFLKEIYMGANSIFNNLKARILTLAGHTLTGVAVDDTTDEDSTTDIATPAYIKSVSNDRYLRKDQDDYTPYLLGVNRLESNHIQSTEYTGDGMLDAGYKLWYENGRAKLVIDDLVARGKFSVNELESRIWTYAGGNMVFSGAGSTVFYVEYLDGNGNALGYTYVREPWLLRGKMMLASGIAWAKRKQIQRELTAAEKAQVVKFRCYEYSDDGTMQTRNWWRANDLAYCSSLNHVKDKANSDGSYSGSASNTVFWRRVAGIGSKKIPALNDGRVYDYVDLWNLQNVTGQTYKDTDGSTKTITDSVPGYDSTYNDWPAAGDVIVQRGNAVDVTRQCCVTIEVEGDQLHGFKIYDTINTYSAANTQWVSLGYDLQTGKADMKVFGDAYIGARDQSTYVRYNRTTGVLDIKAKINMASPLGDTGKTFAQTLTAIEGQIDKKAETWRQATDPSSDWTTDTEKAEHVGDIWMDISANGGKKTYIYIDKGSGANPRYVWEAQDVPEEVFDDIDGKGAIYSGWEDWIDSSGNNKLQERDLFIPLENTTVSGVTYKAMKVYKCITAGANPVFSEVDYTDDTKVDNLIANQYVSYLLNGSYDTDIANAAAAYTHDAALNAVKGALKSNTVVEGGLMLTSLIALRQLNSGGDPDDPSDYTTWAGISGEYVDRTTPDPQDPSTPYAKGHGIAAWYGGAMIDYEMLTPEQQADGWGGEEYNLRWAKGLDRMDGSGYRASGNISWDANGNVTVKGEDVTAAHYYLSDGTEVTNLLDMFELETDNNNVTWVHVKHGYSFYSDGDISALGAAAGGGGGGGGASVLYELNDVLANAGGTSVLDAQAGYVLTCVENGGSLKWKAAPTAPTYVLPQATSGALGGIKIGYTDATVDTRNYAVALDNDGKAYVNVPWEDHTYTLAGLMGSTAKGGTTQPIYWDGTEFKNTTYTLAKSVPADAVFTDHYDWDDITHKPSFDYLPLIGGEMSGSITVKTDKGINIGSASARVYYEYVYRILGVQSISASTNGTNILSLPTKAGTLAVTDDIAWSNVSSKPSNIFCYQGEVGTAYVNGTKYSTLDSGTYYIQYSGSSGSLIHFQHGGSASGLDIKFDYTQDLNNPLYYRKTIDSNRFASTDWVALIDSLNIGSQSVDYANSAGSAGNVTGTVAIGNGGTGATTAATARGNLGTPALITDSYPTLITADGTTNNWIKIGTANTSYGLIPSQSGGAGSGHNYLGTDSWYWKYLYVDEVHSTKCEIYDTTPSVHVGTSSSARISLHWSNDNNRGLYDYTGYWVIGANTNTFLMRGNVGIGTTSPSYKLHVSGDIYATGDVTAASDQRKKEFVEDVVLTLEQIANAPAVKFRWKDDRDSLVHIGTYAQYWLDILPESVSDRGGELGFTYGNTALVAVKNLARYVMQLEEEIRQLKKKQNKSA